MRREAEYTIRCKSTVNSILPTGCTLLEEHKKSNLKSNRIQTVPLKKTILVRYLVTEYPV